MAMTKGEKKALKNIVIGLIIRDAVILSDLICEAAIDYRVQDIKISWRKLLRNEIFISGIHETMAQKH